MRSGKHVFELAPYNDVRLSNIIMLPEEPLTVAFLEKELDLGAYPYFPLDFVPSEIGGDVEEKWIAGLKLNPKLKNNLLPSMRGIHQSDGRLTIHTGLTTYKSSYWVKKRQRGEYHPNTEEAIANAIAPLNVGAIMITADDMIMAGLRPAGLTGHDMLLNIPCGYVLSSDGSIKSALNRQTKHEVGIPLYSEQDDELTSLDLHILEEPTLLGVQRESDELVPIVTFQMRTTYRADELAPPKYEVSRVRTLPADPRKLADYLVEGYVPSLGYPGEAIPNLIGMCLLHLRGADLNLYHEALGRIQHEATKKYDTQVMVRDSGVKIFGT